ncbi:hypothetical protein RIR_jg35493.t1 [Rhizophagus irregularis DAOM 181602=DAOM 197198]|nr:hypothetical protein RIR_jg35493.t1 [Rhizophagus irregularis DAOM 181602=DAOM 197198]
MSEKRKNESESEGSPGETAQKTSRKQATQIASQKRKKFESESESSSAPKRRFTPAENAVIPDVEVTIPDTYIQPNINGEMLSNLRFRVANVAGLTDVEVRTFFKKLHKFVTNASAITHYANYTLKMILTRG